MENENITQNNQIIENITVDSTTSNYEYNTSNTDYIYFDKKINWYLQYDFLVV